MQRDGEEYTWDEMAAVTEDSLTESLGDVFCCLAVVTTCIKVVLDAFWQAHDLLNFRWWLNHVCCNRRFTLLLTGRIVCMMTCIL